MRIIQTVKMIRKNYDGEFDNFDLGFLKRQIYHMIFLSATPSDSPYAAIEVNEYEYSDEYNGIFGVYLRFVNSGMAKDSGMSFKEFLGMPNWFCDKAIDWHTKQSLINSKAQTDEVDKEMDKIVRAAKKDNFMK